MDVQDLETRPVSRALVIVGHGSHLNAASSAPVYQHAAVIRRMGLFDEVVEAFWKEEPSLADVLATIESEEIVVVPLFLAEGYFTRQVVPRELGVAGTLGPAETGRVRYAPPVGVHPGMADLVLERAQGVAGLSAETIQSTVLLVVGHGTDRSPTSGRSVYRLVEQLKRVAGFAEVRAAFLDEEPRVDSVLNDLRCSSVVLVPFFVAEGWHSGETLPGQLALEGPVTSTVDRTIWYTQPVGTMPEVADMILDLAGQADVFRELPLPAGSSGDASEARLAFFSWIDGSAERGREFLQVRIWRDRDGLYNLCHADENPATATLTKFSDPEAVLGISRFDAFGGYRPLRTTGDLSGGWLLGPVTGAAVWRALSLLYPSCVLHWHQYRSGAFRPSSFSQWAERQTGVYENVRRLAGSDLAQVVDECCGRCLRTRLWEAESRPASRADGSEIGRLPVIPCREPCTVFGSAARDQLEQRSESHSSLPGVAQR